jgi:hypothetical protein
MRIKRDYFSAAKRFSAWFFSRFKPLTVHTEAIMIDSVWEKIKEEVRKKSVFKWYIMTPVNKDYFKSEFNVKISKEKLSEIMKKRYKWMLKHEQKLELHIHLSLVMGNMSYKEQEKLFKEALDWIKKELGINVREFVPGWWSYNEDTLKLCKKYGLKMIKEKDYDYTHDYFEVLNWVKTKE